MFQRRKKNFTTVLVMGYNKLFNRGLLKMQLSSMWNNSSIFERSKLNPNQSKDDFHNVINHAIWSIDIISIKFLRNDLRYKHQFRLFSCSSTLKIKYYWQVFAYLNMSLHQDSSLLHSLCRHRQLCTDYKIVHMLKYKYAQFKNGNS